LRKYFLIFIISIVFFVLPLSVNADDDILDFKYMQIKDGLNDYYEATFEEIKTIYGEGEKGTEITFYLYKKVKDDSIKVYKDTIVIGASGIFSQSIKLPLDISYLLITVDKNDQKVKQVFVINRKKIAIKETLESIVALPGISLKIE